MVMLSYLKNINKQSDVQTYIIPAMKITNSVRITFQTPVINQFSKLFVKN